MLLISNFISKYETLKVFEDLEYITSGTRAQGFSLEFKIRRIIVLNMM